MRIHWNTEAHSEGEVHDPQCVAALLNRTAGGHAT